MSSTVPRTDAPPKKKFHHGQPLIVYFKVVSNLQLASSTNHEPVIGRLCCSICHYDTIRDATKCRVATFSFSQSGTGVWGGAPSRLASGGITPENFRNSICDLAHFDAIWWQLFVGRRTRYICNFAVKIEPVCQLQCPHDCTVVLPLLSNERALKSGTFGVPGLVLAQGRDIPGNPGWVATLIMWSLSTSQQQARIKHTRARTHTHTPRRTCVRVVTSYHSHDHTSSTLCV